MQGPCGDGDDPFALEGGHLLGTADVVVGAVAQPVIVALAPREHRPGTGQGHAELGTALNLQGARGFPTLFRRIRFQILLMGVAYNGFLSFVALSSLISQITPQM